MIMGLYILLWGKNRDASMTVASTKEEEEEEDKEKQIKPWEPNYATRGF